MSYLSINPEKRSARRYLKIKLIGLHKLWSLAKNKRTEQRYHEAMLYRAVLLNKYKKAGIAYKGRL